MESAAPARPVVGLVGSEGAYGRWLRRFFAEGMGLEVIGRDPADRHSPSVRELVERADVLVFAAPIRHTPALIAEYAQAAGGIEQGRLWLDVTSIKRAPVEAMLASRADVVGLHPMTAPPKSPNLKGRVVVVCEARLSPRWRGWFDGLLQRLQGEYVRTDPDRHDRIMALVQALVHAGHLAQAKVIGSYAGDLGTLAGLMPFRSAAFEQDASVISRILSMNPAIYEDIQFENPYAADVLARLVHELTGLQQLIAAGDEAARAGFRERFFAASRQRFDEQSLHEGNYTYERIGYLLADLTEPRAISVYLPLDRPGSLRDLLQVFERHGINLASIHSSRTPRGELHFRIGFDKDVTTGAMHAASLEINTSGIGRVLGTVVPATAMRPVLPDGVRRRKAMAADVAPLIALRETVLAGYLRASGADASPPALLARVLEGIGDADIFERDGRVVGVLKLDRSGADWLVDQIQLAPELQGQGLGGRLIEAFVAEAHAAGHDVVLQVLKANPARRLYERLGFVVEAEDACEFHMRRARPRG